MNYIKQVNAFYKLIQDNPLSSNAQCLYNYLLNKDSELGWKSEFSVSNLIVCGFTCLSRQALDRARNELVQKGYIKYKKGHSNQAGKYLIVCFDTQNDTQDSTQSDTQGNTQSGHDVSTLNKQKEKKPNNKKIEKENQRTKIKEIYNQTCSKLPQIQKLTEKREKAIDNFLKEYTVEQFEKICKIANSSEFLTGKNDRGWKADFDFLIKTDKATSVLEGKYSGTIQQKKKEYNNYEQRDTSDLDQFYANLGGTNEQ